MKHLIFNRELLEKALKNDPTNLPGFSPYAGHGLGDACAILESDFYIHKYDRALKTRKYDTSKQNKLEENVYFVGLRSLIEADDQRHDPKQFPVPYPTTGMNKQLSALKAIFNCPVVVHPPLNGQADPIDDNRVHIHLHAIPTPECETTKIRRSKRHYNYFEKSWVRNGDGFLPTGENEAIKDPRRGPLAEIKGNNIYILQSLYPHIDPNAGDIIGRILSLFIDSLAQNSGWRDRVIDAFKHDFLLAAVDLEKDRLKSSRTDLIKLRGQYEKTRAELLSMARELSAAEAQHTALHNTYGETSVKIRWADYFKQIKSMDCVQTVHLIDAKLAVKTRPLILIEQTTQQPHYIGQFTINIDMRDGLVTINNNEDAFIRQDGVRIDHPLVENGHAYFGMSDIAISEAIARKDPVAAIMMITSFLRSAPSHEQNNFIEPVTSWQALEKGAPAISTYIDHLIDADEVRADLATISAEAKPGLTPRSSFKTKNRTGMTRQSLTASLTGSVKKRA